MKKTRIRLLPWLYLSPAITLLTIFLFVPIIYLIYLSFTDGNLINHHWVWLKNYHKLILDPDFSQIIFNTFYFCLCTIIPSILIPLLLSILLTQNILLQKFFRTTYFLPSITSLIAIGLGFRWLFQNNGPINQILIQISIPPINWLNDKLWAMPIIIVFSIWRQIGFNLVIFLAGLQSIPQNLYEAAELDGSKFWSKLWYITIPCLRGTLILTTITTTIFTLRSFEQVYIVTNGGPNNSTNILAFYVYEQAFKQFDFGYASASTTILLIAALILVLVQLRAIR